MFIKKILRFIVRFILIFIMSLMISVFAGTVDDYDVQSIFEVRENPPISTFIS